MVDVCFDDGECGLIKFCLLRLKSGDYVPQNEAEQAILDELRASLADGVNVVGIESVFTLNLGGISKADFEAERKRIIRHFYSFWLSEVEADDKYAEIQGNFSKIVESAKNGESLRLWLSDAAYSMCSLCYLLNLLADVDCEVQIVRLKKKFRGAKREIPVNYFWFDVQPQKFLGSIETISVLSSSEKQKLADEWTRLEGENAPLRILKNGRIESVGADHFDDLILKLAPKRKSFNESRLIGKALAQDIQNVGVTQLSMRIDELIEAGIFEIVRKPIEGQPEYKKIIRRKNAKRDLKLG